MVRKAYGEAAVEDYPNLAFKVRNRLRSSDAVMVAN